MNKNDEKLKVINQQYLFILSIIEKHDCEKINELLLNALICETINDWQNAIKRTFNNEIKWFYSFNDHSYDQFVKDLFNNDYLELLKKMQEYAYLTYLKNDNNIIAKNICMAFSKNNYNNIDMKNSLNELFNGMIKKDCNDNIKIK